MQSWGGVPQGTQGGLKKELYSLTPLRVSAGHHEEPKGFLGAAVLVGSPLPWPPSTLTLPSCSLLLPAQNLVFSLGVVRWGAGEGASH